MRAIPFIFLCAPCFACTVRLIDDTTGTTGTTGTTDGEWTDPTPTTSGSASAMTTALDGGTTNDPGTTEQVDSSTGTASSTGPDLPPDDTCGFLCDPGVDPLEPSCNTFAQDCPDGEKCTAYAEGGGSSWNNNKCVPVTGDGHRGDPCTVVGSAISGLDDCAKGSMCWNVDAEGHGHCIDLCIGSEAAPSCSEAGAVCHVNGDGVLNLCTPSCDPLAQNCSGTDLCIWLEPSFMCVLDASGDAGQAFDPCEYANTCDPGLICVNPELGAECDPDVGGCCLPFCDLSLPTDCPGVGQSCVPFFAEGEAPEANMNVGLCSLPR